MRYTKLVMVVLLCGCAHKTTNQVSPFTGQNRQQMIRWHQQHDKKPIVQEQPK